MLVGYARVSLEDQNLSLQLDALKNAGCEKIFTDKSTRRNFDREGFCQVIEFMRAGDTLVIWKLDRLGGSLKGLIETSIMLHNRGIELKSLKETIDTSTANGRFYFNTMCSLTEFEVDIIRERTYAGLAAARARGKKGGRPHALNTAQIELVKSLYKSGEHKIEDICNTVGISKPTLYAYLKS
ncbi:hypothetical protein A1D23_12475 [Chelonobacter oris]|uniref:recombinase family protein n=1 Tax=Chelonobacter oris TaxID=505317 RepID=UPI00244960CB|nr:recombinase family protein [Chelonobacter oris]MDH3001333.1 hypothetical protein [Chelonobacter oris]